MKKMILTALLFVATQALAIEVQPFAKTGIELGGVAQLSKSRFLAVSYSGEVRIIDGKGKIVGSRDLGVSVNRPPLAFPAGGAMVVSLAREDMGETNYFFFDKSGELIRTQKRMGKTGARLQAQPDGTIASTPVGQIVFFNPKGDEVRSIPLGPVMLFSPPHFFPDGGFHVAAGDINDPIRVQYDSFFAPDGTMINKIERFVPTYSPAFLKSGLAVFPHWDGEVFATDSSGKVKGRTSLGDLGSQDAITLDGKVAIVSNISGLFAIKPTADSIEAIRLSDHIVTTPVVISKRRFITVDWNQVLVFDQETMMRGNSAPISSRTLITDDELDHAREPLLRIAKDEFLAYTTGGNLYRVKLSKSEMR